MKVKMLVTATVVALLSLVFAEKAEAQRYGGGGYYRGGRNCGPNYAPQRYYNNNNCGPRGYARPRYYRPAYRPVARYRQNCGNGFSGSFSNGYTTVTVNNGGGYYGGNSYYNNGYYNNGGRCGNGYYNGGYRRW